MERRVDPGTFVQPTASHLPCFPSPPHPHPPVDEVCGGVSTETDKSLGARVISPTRYAPSPLPFPYLKSLQPASPHPPWLTYTMPNLPPPVRSQPTISGELGKISERVRNPFEDVVSVDFDVHMETYLTAFLTPATAFSDLKFPPPRPTLRGKITYVMLHD